MKKVAVGVIMFFLVLLLGSVIFLTERAKADEAVIKITEFVRLGDANSVLAEVCGVVSGIPANHIDLKVLADHDSKIAGENHTFTGYNGSFCMIIRTVYGTVEVSLMNSTPKVAVTSVLKH